MPRNGVSSAAPSRAPPRPAGRSRGSASRPPSISSHRAHGASQASPSASRSPFAKPKGRTVSEPEEAASPGRHHPGRVGEIISEWRATSNRNGGRDHSGMVGDIERNQHTTVGPTKIVQSPAWHAVIKLFLELAPAGDRPLVRDTAREKQISIVATRYAFQNFSNNIPVRECVLF